MYRLESRVHLPEGVEEHTVIKQLAGMRDTFGQVRAVSRSEEMRVKR
jgi:hypothetical protein